jgi:tRNA (guanine10-N2)-dimethyltransferase
MQSSLFILGRQPALGLVELERLFGSEKITPIGSMAASVSIDPDDVPFDRLGGSIKLAAVLTERQTTNWDELVTYISSILPSKIESLPEGKIKLGISAYGINAGVQQINKGGLQIKKSIKHSGRSVRVVPNNEHALNSAQVIHNQLLSPLGLELIFVANGRSTIIAQTLREQDIEAYAARDQRRPKRDARVGMLPPKLAQIIINLAVGNMKQKSVVLDPFCGTGVVLQEAGLMGYTPYGSDLEPRMIEYSTANIQWVEKLTGESLNTHLEVGDATELEWKPKPDAIAGETYLGRPFSSLPDRETLTGVMQDVNLIHKRFLQNVARQTSAGFELCIAIPAWKTPEGFKHLKLLDSLEDLGYTRLSFVHADNKDLLYHREGQIVARELVVLIRK